MRPLARHRPAPISEVIPELVPDVIPTTFPRVPHFGDASLLLASIDPVTPQLRFVLVAPKLGTNAAATARLIRRAPATCVPLANNS